MIGPDYKHIIIGTLPLKPKRKTHEHIVYNKKSGERIGVIQWYGPWRQYCFFPDTSTIWSAGCLADVIDFIERLKMAKGNEDD